MRHHRRSSSSDQPDSSPWSLLITAQVLLVVGVSAWAFGGSLPWGPGLVVGCTLLALPLLLARLQERGVIRKRAFIPALLWLAFTGIAILNPSHVIGELGWQPVASWKPWLPGTPDPERTKAALLPWLAVLLQGGLLAACPLTSRQTRRIWGFIALNGFVLAIVGAGFHFLGATKLLGFVDGPDTYFFATFFYKNHWAVYGALCGGAGLTLALDAWPRALQGSPDARGRVFLYGITALFTLVTLPIPGSRSGFILAAVLLLGAGGMFLGVALRQKLTGPSRWIPVGALVALILGTIGYGAFIFGQQAEKDLVRTQRQIASAKKIEDLELRVVLSRDTWHMAEKRLWFGWGPGSYEIVFPVFQGDYLRDSDGRSTVRFLAAHNDWLQQLAETGVIGCLILLVPLTLTGFTGWRRGSLASRCALGTGCLILVYALVDFPFHNMAILVVFTVLWTTAGRLGSSQSSARR